MIPEQVATTPFSSEVLCLDHPIVRLLAGADAVKNSGPSGHVTRTLDLTRLPQFTSVIPNSSWSYQFVHRDTNASGVPVIQLTNAVTLTY